MSSSIKEAGNRNVIDYHSNSLRAIQVRFGWPGDFKSLRSLPGASGKYVFFPVRTDKAILESDLPLVLYTLNLYASYHPDQRW